MSFSHPRRTTKTTSSALTPSSSNASGRSPSNMTMSLRKSATFHSPSTTPEPELEQPFKVPSLPRRSQTSLEDVVDAHKRRVAITLGDIEVGLSAKEDRSPTSTRQSFPDEADPVPRAFLDHTVSPSSIMDGLLSKDTKGKRNLRPRSIRRPSRYADSGLGSSIKSEKHAGETGVTERCVRPTATLSAITRGAAAHSSTQNLPRLSVRASNRIHEHILKPILAKSSLKDFHPIIRDCPRRIHQKEIVCLRDLEKTLIFMAPERTKTAALYLDFCLTSIRCIQATVEFLNEREQTRPHDRPYSNGYFVDLVDQIKQYAQQVQAAKEKQEKGESLDEMDPESTDEVKLHGGLTKNGRPAELVRVKKSGKAFSIATGKPVDMEEDSKMQFKRSLSEEAEDDESILRSMARRKRSASAAELAPKRCREPGCDKEFKRPCDLTKHEKTHSRPWKCPVENCKYHEYGWPTEKEMDRHHNDKHSAAPPLYECHFKPCPYRSKRESNCKQHMEKAHGWEYVRSKNNGKNRDKQANNNGLPTPQTTNIRTPSSDGNTVHTPEEEDMDMTEYEPSNFYAHAQNQINFPTYSNTSEIDMFGDHQLQLEYSPISELNNSTASSSSPYPPNTMAQDQLTEQFQNFTHGGASDFGLYDDDLYSANVQLPPSNHEVFRSIENSQYKTSGLPYVNPAPHISPVGQGNTMLFTPKSLCDVDEGFEDFMPTNTSNNSHLNNADFQLYPSSTSGTVSSSAPSALFGEIPTSNPNFPGVTAQDLLDFYAASTHAATHNGINMTHGMDWSSDDQFGYGQ